jgi:hypothetical protein
MYLASAYKMSTLNILRDMCLDFKTIDGYEGLAMTSASLILLPLQGEKGAETRLLQKDNG